VFTGAGDGRLRIYDASSGRVLWEYDTMVDTKTVGGGVARGGSMGGGAGPIVYNGLLIVPSGYGFAGRMPGNVLLVVWRELSAADARDRDGRDPIGRAFQCTRET
jgi:polyvinyl alcohol dehydrogenase (cytochrome)